MKVSARPSLLLVVLLAVLEMWHGAIAAPECKTTSEVTDRAVNRPAASWTAPNSLSDYPPFQASLSRASDAWSVLKKAIPGEPDAYLQVDLGKPVLVSMLRLLGSGGGYEEWIITMRMRYKTAGSEFALYDGGKAIQTGLTDAQTPADLYVTEFVAQVIRFEPTHAVSNYYTLQVGVFGCDFRCGRTEQLVQYFCEPKDVGEVCEFDCGSGMLSKTSVTCQADGHWESWPANPVCETVCGPSAAFPPTGYKCADADNSIGTECKATCPEPYTEKTTTIECRANGKWSDWNDDACPKSCPESEKFADLGKCDGPARIGDLCEIKCEDSVRAVSAECRSDGTWTPFPADDFCDNPTCGDSPVLPGTSVACTNGPYEPGKTCDHLCAKSGTTVSIACEDSGVWEDWPDGGCPARCDGAPELRIRGETVTPAGCDAREGGFEPGATCEYECGDGFDTKETIRCGGNGEWEPWRANPCPVKCGPVPALANIQILPVIPNRCPAAKLSNDVGAKCTRACGTSGDGSEYTIACQDNGEWQAWEDVIGKLDNPCSIYCGSSLPLEDGVVDCPVESEDDQQKYPYKAGCTHTCKKAGWTTTVFCQANGKWGQWPEHVCGSCGVSPPTPGGWACVDEPYAVGRDCRHTCKNETVTWEIAIECQPNGNWTEWPDAYCPVTSNAGTKDTTGADKGGSSGGGLSIGLIVGAAAGGVVLLILVIAVVVLVQRGGGGGGGGSGGRKSVYGEEAFDSPSMMTMNDMHESGQYDTIGAIPPPVPSSARPKLEDQY